MKKVPNLRFKEFSGEWESNKIEKICDIITDYVAAGSFENIRNSVTYYNSENFAQLVRTIDLKSNFNNKDFIFVDEKAYNFLYRVNLNEDSIILPNIGANIGESYYVEPEKLPSENNVLGPNAILLRSEINNTKYIYYLFNTKAFHKQLVQIIGASGQPKFNKTELKQMKFYVPTIEEQEKIASFFSLIDKKIELQTEKVEELKNYKKGLMQKIFSQELRFKGFSGEWESKKIGSICEIIMGQSPSSACYNEDKIGLPLIQGNADIKNRKTFPRVYTSDITKTCDVGDIIMSVRAPVGAISRSLHHACIGRGVCSIKPKQNSEFIYQFLLNYENKWSRISQGSTFESINSFDITSTNIVLPLKEEQEKIASFFSLIDKKLELEMEKLEQLQEYKKGLLQQMFI